MAKEVYIVHCIDTEGPLYESIDATFERLESVFNVCLEHTKENLIKLQNKAIDLGGVEEAVFNMVEPKRLNTNDTWEKLDRMLDRILSDDFREQLLDSEGKGWIYNWFCVDHVGFKDVNPRRRDAGHHNIYDHYHSRNKDNKDLIQFHYHPVSICGHFNVSGTTYLNSNNIFDILCRKVIDRNWFPSCFRPGFHTERPDSHWFLEQWIPFDYANQATENLNNEQLDLSNGRFGDWRRAIKEWKPYHPSHDDYQVEGNCRRWIARCLNMDARIREIRQKDFIEGFKRANDGESTIISFTNHDFRDMTDEIDKMRKMINEASKIYPEVKFYYSNAISAMRKALDMKVQNINLDFNIKIKENNTAIMEISSNDNIFGPQPFLAIKTITGEYIWENLDFQGNNKWTYHLDENTLKTNMIEKIGVAANSKEGLSEVVVYDFMINKKIKKIYNE